MIYLLLLILHILCCFLILLGIWLKLLKVKKILFWFSLFLPVWGPLLTLVLHVQILLKQIGKTEVGVEKFQVESELYKGISQDVTRDSRSTVSMEEALIVNTPKERRELIMNILNDNPKAYVEFLKMAGNNEDTEVVHYAVTAMVQISQENDQMLWELEQKFTEHPEDLEVISIYCAFLWHCLEQGLMEGRVELMNRNLFDDLIHKKIHLGNPSVTDYLHCIENSMKLKNYTEAGAMLSQARKLWPQDENLWVLHVQYYADLKRPQEIQKLIQELENGNFYLSSRGEVIAFWRE